MTEEFSEDIRAGELVLIRPYHKCKFMILAKFLEPSPEGNDSFYARKAEILYRQEENQIIPHVDQDFEKANTSDPNIKGGIISYNTFRDVYEIKLFSHRESTYWLGLEAISGVLGDAIPFSSHTAALQEIEEAREAYRASMEDWLGRLSK
jgi:hypothetical protein